MMINIAKTRKYVLQMLDYVDGIKIYFIPIFQLRFVVVIVLSNYGFYQSFAC